MEGVTVNYLKVSELQITNRNDHALNSCIGILINSLSVYYLILGLLDIHFFQEHISNEPWFFCVCFCCVVVVVFRNKSMRLLINIVY